jgi:hypothetical protein
MKATRTTTHTDRPSPTELDRIGRVIEIDGLDTVPRRLIDDVVGYARRFGIRPVATSVLADARAPTVVRERAYGKVALAIAGHLIRTPAEASAA